MRALRGLAFTCRDSVPATPASLAHSASAFDWRLNGSPRATVGVPSLLLSSRVLFHPKARHSSTPAFSAAVWFLRCPHRHPLPAASVRLNITLPSDLIPSESTRPAPAPPSSNCNEPLLLHAGASPPPAHCRRCPQAPALQPHCPIPLFCSEHRFRLLLLQLHFGSPRPIRPPLHARLACAACPPAMPFPCSYVAHSGTPVSPLPSSLLLPQQLLRCCCLPSACPKDLQLAPPQVHPSPDPHPTHAALVSARALPSLSWPCRRPPGFVGSPPFCPPDCACPKVRPFIACLCATYLYHFACSPAVFPL